MMMVKHEGRFGTLHFCIILPAQRYASAGTSCGPVSVRLSVRLCLCLSQFDVLSSGIYLVFGLEASFDQSNAVL